MPVQTAGVDVRRQSSRVEDAMVWIRGDNRHLQPNGIGNGNGIAEPGETLGMGVLTGARTACSSCSRAIPVWTARAAGQPIAGPTMKASASGNTRDVRTAARPDG